MTDSKLTELKNIARNILAQNRLQILNKHPWIGTIAMNLDLVPTRDPRLSTAMTDGNTIFFDIDFLSRLTSDEVQFVLGHEIWHTVMLHFLRTENREMNLFNIAADMEVNQILEADGFIAPKDALFPNKKHNKTCQYNFEDGLNAEQYYDLLMNMNNEKKDQQLPENESFNSDEGSKKSKSNKKDCSGQFDKHFNKNENMEESLKEAIEKGAEDKYGKKEEADIEFTPRQFTNDNQIREASERVREMVVGATQQYERSKGELPGHIKKQIEKLLESKMPWKELLAAFITTGIGTNKSWNTPNRRFAWNGTYLPSNDGDMIKIAVGIDTSGSCAEKYKEFFSEVNGIVKSFDQYEVHMMQCDTEVKNYAMYDQNNPLNPDEKIDFEGFGGTNLHPIFQYMDLNDIKADAAVIFTDGVCEKFDQNEMFDIPILWVITGNHDCKNLEIGEKVYMN